MLTGRNTQHACAHTLSVSYTHIHSNVCNVWTFAILVGGVPTDHSQRACYRLLAIAWISVVTGSKGNQILPLPSFQEGATRPWVMAVWPGEAIAWDSSQVGEPHAYSSSPHPAQVWGRGIGRIGPWGAGEKGSNPREAETKSWQVGTLQNSLEEIKGKK